MADWDYLKMVIEIAVFAVVIYSVLRFLRETRGSGVVRGLALILAVSATSFLILIQARRTPMVRGPGSTNQYSGTPDFS